LIYINENSSVWDKIEEPEYQEVTRNVDAPTITITDENKIVGHPHQVVGQEVPNE
jgi:hypothetical protein